MSRYSSIFKGPGQILVVLAWASVPLLTFIPVDLQIVCIKCLNLSRILIN
jgi:hypothetical protein